MKIALAVVLSLATSLALAADAVNYRVGRAISDVTLPVWGIQMLGYVHPDQVGEGLRQRQFARTFVIADALDRTRLAYVTTDVAFVTHTLKLAVLERLHARLPGRYTHANLILTGTHTHGTPGGYHHHLSVSLLGGDLFIQAFDALADGIAESVLAADSDLQPARIFLAQGDVAEANANRSNVAYRNNPEQERARYPSDVDKRMTLLRFQGANGPLGLLNWFAVHPTSVNFHYKLTTSDNKGYAAYLMEQARGNRYAQPTGFVAAFANSNCGDVTPNLNLDATGPGQTDLESCTIIGRRQADAAERLFAEPGEPLSGPIDVRHTFVDFSAVTISDEFTGAGEQHTCPSAWGYAFAAGSDAEGGGHVLFREGMTRSVPAIDAIIRLAIPNSKPPDDFIQRQKPKAILVASGLLRPTMHEQVLPIAVARIGQLLLAIGPAEYTTMSGRRFREAVAKEFGTDPRYVVIAGYANDFAGYVTTWHEYQLQQYEGGHTLFGPWTEAAYRQEFARLARALRDNQPLPETTAAPTDMRTVPHQPTLLDGPDEEAPAKADFGDVVTPPGDRYRPGEIASATFWTGSPVNDYSRLDQFLAVEQLVAAPNTWQTVRSDLDWETTAQWKRFFVTRLGRNRPSRPERNGLLNLSPPRYTARPDPFQVTLTWEIAPGTTPGTYRLVHYGRHKQSGKVVRFTAVTPAFEVSP